MGSNHHFAGLLQYSVKSFGFNQDKLYKEFAKNAGLVNRDVSNLCFDGTCAAIAARWAYEKASGARLEHGRKMFVGELPSKSDRKAKQDAVLNDPRAKQNSMFTRDEWNRLDTEFKEKKETLFRHHLTFYENLGRMQADAIRDKDHDCILQFHNYSDNEGIAVSARPRENSAFSPDVAEIGSSTDFVSLKCLKEVNDPGPLYVVYRMRGNNKSVGHAIAVICDDAQNKRVFFDPNAGEYRVPSAQDWEKFIDEYIRIVEKMVFKPTTTSVKLFSVSVINKA